MYFGYFCWLNGGVIINLVSNYLVEIFFLMLFVKCGNNINLYVFWFICVFWRKYEYVYVYVYDFCFFIFFEFCYFLIFFVILVL